MEISNKFYSFALRYSLPVIWNPVKQMAVVDKSKRTLIPSSLFFFFMIFGTTCSFDLVVEVLVFKNITMPMPVLLFIIFVLQIDCLCLALMIILYPILKYFLRSILMLYLTMRKAFIVAGCFV